MRKNLCCHWEKHNLIQAAPRQRILISRHVGKHGLSVRLAETPLASTAGLKPKDSVPSIESHTACTYVHTHQEHSLTETTSQHPQAKIIVEYHELVIYYIIYIYI